MGTFLFYAWLPWFRLYSATRWDATLPCQPPAVSPGAAPRARWFPADLVCCTRRSLPFLSLARPVSGEQHHAQTTTSECGPVAAQRLSSDTSPASDTTLAPHPSAPVLWRDWPRCGIRRTWLKGIRSQTTCLGSSSPCSSSLAPAEKTLTRAERAHWRLSWVQRLARNARPADAPRLTVTLHGLPATFASSFGFDLLATA